LCALLTPAPVLLTNNMQYKERYFEIYGDASTVPLVKRREEAKVKMLLRQLSDDEDDGSTTHSTPTNPGKPWLAGFQLYLDTQDHFNGMSTVGWWGVSSCFHTVWLQLISDADECAPLSCLGVTRWRFSIHHVIIGVERAGIFGCWHHHQ
jgi:hypothetical protein